MAKKPYSCNCVWAAPNQVNCVRRLKCGHVVANSASPDSTKQTNPNFIWQNEPPRHSVLAAPQTVFQPITAMARTGTINSNELTALNVGSHAGTGAPTGIPRNEPNSIRVKNANNA